MTPKAVLFDWDGTLVDSWGVIVESFQQAQKELGHEVWSYDKTRRSLGKSLRDQFPIIFGDEWEKARDIYYRHFESVHLNKVTLIDGTREILELLKSKNIYMAIVSNKTGRFLRPEVESLGLSGYFSAIVGAADSERDKPHPAPLYMALEDFNDVIDENVWYVGDANIDMEASHRAGCAGVRVCAPGMEMPTQDPVYKAKYILKTVKDIIELPELM